MEHKYFKVEVGDQVMISPEYWRSAGNGMGFTKPYSSNGPDYIYTITDVFDEPPDYWDEADFEDDEFRLIYLDGMDHNWSNKYIYLSPVTAAPDFEISDDLSVLFE